MKRLAIAAVATLILTGCAPKAALEESADGRCSANQSQSVQEHISGQIRAFSKEDWESAYSFASNSFRETVPLEQFIVVIGTQYQMLIVNDGFEFGSCEVDEMNFTQQVSVSSQSEKFVLSYELSYIDKKIGIESAIVSVSEVQTDI